MRENERSPSFPAREQEVWKERERDAILACLFRSLSISLPGFSFPADGIESPLFRSSLAFLPFQLQHQQTRKVQQS